MGPGRVLLVAEARTRHCGPAIPPRREQHMPSSITRARFVRGGMKGGLALVAGGTVLAAAAGTAGAATASGDVAIAKVAATAELLAVDFYTRSIDSGVFGGRRERYLSGARAQEQDHYDA